jgi:hypothetical protein
MDCNVDPSFTNPFFSNWKEGKAIPIIDREGQQGSGTLTIPHLLENRLTDGRKVVSLTSRPPFTPQEIFWYSFLLDAE